MINPIKFITLPTPPTRKNIMYFIFGIIFMYLLVHFEKLPELPEFYSQDPDSNDYHFMVVLNTKGKFNGSHQGFAELTNKKLYFSKDDFEEVDYNDADYNIHGNKKDKNRADHNSHYFYKVGYNETSGHKYILFHESIEIKSIHPNFNNLKKIKGLTLEKNKITLLPLDDNYSNNPNRNENFQF
uniref:Uncharacterized protein n=1 Tax=viral metagenome TaxID=1070528 RepID=A0A6C0FD71_9ZZZZ|tara:strand:- start:825 stop:1376 length:552 start_codon:yes stop_codon:yes gene_type:complete